MLEVFVFYNFPRLNRNCLAKRNSGGLGVFVRNSTKEDVIFIKSFDDVVAWFKLRKDRFQLPNDIYLDNVYVAPEGSSYLNYDVFDLIKEDIAKFPSGTQVLISGHYNARTVRHPMFISTHVMVIIMAWLHFVQTCALQKMLDISLKLLNGQGI